MAKEKFERSKPHVNIGTIGHVDHGKTTLTAAISKTLSSNDGSHGTAHADFTAFEDIDKAPEERAAASRSPSPTSSTRRIPATTLTWTARSRRLREEHDHGCCSDGRRYPRYRRHRRPMAQTREHILLARQVGVPYIVVFLNKCDMVDDEELLELVEMEVRELLDSYEFPGDDTPIIRGSALNGLEGDAEWQSKIWELMDAVDSYIRRRSATWTTRSYGCRGHDDHHRARHRCHRPCGARYAACERPARDRRYP